MDYRKSQESVWHHIRIKVNSKNRCILYDSELVDACLRLFNEKGFNSIDFYTIASDRFVIPGSINEGQ